MRFFLLFLVFFILILTIYRRMIEPFLEGYRGNRKPYNEPRIRDKRKRKHSIDRTSMEEAEFEDITE